MRKPKYKYDRAFTYTINYKKSWFCRKPVSITIIDGWNEITVGLHDWFVIYTNEELEVPIIKDR